MTESEYSKWWYSKNRVKHLAACKAYRKKNYEECKRREELYRNNNRKKNREYTRAWHIKRKYGLSVLDRNNLLKKQNHKCALCGELLGRKFSIDHCHKSGKVRGIVHQFCNLVLGFSKEDVNILKKTIKYIKKHKI
jgi:hypothetical protein